MAERRLHTDAGMFAEFAHAPPAADPAEARTAELFGEERE